MGIGGFSSQSSIREGTDVVHIDLGVWLHRKDTRLETIHIQLGIARLNRTHNTNYIALAHACCQSTVNKATFLRGSFIGKDIRLAKSVHGCAPRKAGLGEVGSDLLKGGAVL